MVSPTAKAQTTAGTVPSSVLGSLPITSGLLDTSQPAPPSQVADYVYRIAALTAGLVLLGTFL
jgi:hypothetical protein